MTRLRSFRRLTAAALAAMACASGGHAQQAYDPFKGAEGKSQAAATAGDIVGPKEAVDFGAVQSGRDRVTRAISLTNEGGLGVKVTDIRLAAPDDQLEISQESCKNLDLPTGAKCTVAVTWRPSRPGRLDNVVLVEHSGRTRNITVPLKGQAQAPGFARRNGATEAEDLILASPDKVDFESPSRGSLSSKAILITNIDEQPINISRVELVGSPASLRISDDACSKRSLDPGRACLITLLYTPTAAVDLSINMVVHHSGPRGYVVIPVSGRAPNNEALVAAPASPANPSVAAGGMPSLIPDEPNQGGSTRMRLRGTSGRNAIIERGGRTHIVNDGKPFTADGVTYKVAVTDGSVTLSAENAPTITLDSDPLSLPMVKRDSASEKVATPPAPSGAQPAAPPAPPTAPPASAPAAKAPSAPAPAAATQAARPSAAKQPASNPPPLFGPGAPSWPPAASSQPAAPRPTLAPLTPAPLAPAPLKPPVPKAPENSRAAPELATQPTSPSASNAAAPLIQAAVPDTTLPVLPKPLSAAPASPSVFPQPRIPSAPPTTAPRPEAAATVDTRPERESP